MKTTAAVLVETNRPLEMMELEIPALKPGQCLVEIHYSGICGSQRNEIQGLKGPDKHLPHTLGHEGSGIVLESNCQKVKPGDHVVVSWIKGDGEDAGPIKYGHVNSGPVSTFLTHAVISENRVTPIASDYPLKHAALLGCAVPTGAGIVFNQLDLKAGQSLAVFGVGGIGAAACMAASSLGVHVNAIDRSLGALDRVRAHVVSWPHEHAPLEPREPCDAAIEATGSVEVMADAIDCLKPHGVCVIAGNPPAGQSLRIDPYDLIGGKTLMGSWGGSSHLDRDTPRYAELPIHELLGEEFPLSDINAAFAHHGAGRTMVRCADSA